VTVVGEALKVIVGGVRPEGVESSIGGVAAVARELDPPERIALIAASVLEPTYPTGSRPWLVWKAATAASVLGP